MSSAGKPPLSAAEQAVRATQLAQAHIGFIGLCEQLKKLEVITIDEFEAKKKEHEVEIRKAVGLYQPPLKIVS